jgi:hypothetical protein
VSADPERVEAVLRHPVPRNCKQPRQFLGVCNFHGRFIVGFANYTAPLYSSLEQGTKWEWTSEKQEAFPKLRESFASSIQLVRPSDEKPYAVYTDARKLGISSILSQENGSGEIENRTATGLYSKRHETSFFVGSVEEISMRCILETSNVQCNRALICTVHQ